MRKLLFVSFFVIAAFYANAQRKDILSVQVTFSYTPDEMTVEKTSLKYNKDFALSLHLDDGNQDIYTHAFPLLEGGEYTHNGNNFTSPGYDYTDGCGNDISFKMGAAIYSFSAYDTTDIHDPASGSIAVKWPELIQMYDSGWTVYNHGLNDSHPSDYYCAVRKNHCYVKRKMKEACEGGPEMKVLINPFGDPNYDPVAFAEGYDMTMKVQSFGTPSLDVNTFSNWESLNMGRTVIENHDELNVFVDDLASQSTNGVNLWAAMFSHMITSWNLPFEEFKDFIVYTAQNYGKQGADNIWMATAEEVYDYLLVNDQLNIQTNLSGNVLTITLSGDLPEDLRFYASSLTVNSDRDIQNITFNGGNNNTFHINGTEALINVNWDGYVPVDPQVNAETYVSKAEQTHYQCDVDIAVDYVLLLEPGTLQNEYKGRLCAVPDVVLPENFCVYTGSGLHKQIDYNFKIFPNPVVQEINIYTYSDSEVEIMISDSFGQPALMRSYIPNGGHIRKINLSGLSPGIYFIKIKTENNVHIEKIFKI